MELSSFPFRHHSDLITIMIVTLPPFVVFTHGTVRLPLSPRSVGSRM